jgi:hypothetical protein
MNMAMVTGKAFGRRQQVNTKMHRPTEVHKGGLGRKVGSVNQQGLVEGEQCQEFPWREMNGMNMKGNKISKQHSVSATWSPRSPSRK